LTAFYQTGLVKERIAAGDVMQRDISEMLHKYRCKTTGELIGAVCREKGCEWQLKNELYLNCTWVACNYGPFTLEEVGEMMGVTRERIRQIEAKALKKLQHKKRSEQLKDFATIDSDWDRFNYG
jgi:hypothetical protein